MLSRARRSQPRGGRHHSGRRVARRQLLHRRRAAPGHPRPLAARLLSRAAEARGGASARLPSRPRHRLGLRGAHRQPVRPRGAASLRAGVPARAAPPDRRAVGGGDHAAHRAGRELAAARGADRHQPHAIDNAPTDSPTVCSASAAGTPTRRTSRCAGSGSEPPPRSFSVQLVQRLREQDPTIVPALRWLDERLAAQGTTTDDIVREDHEAQAAMNVTVRNVITSMRLMSAFDWKGFFESVSLVDEELRSGSAFADMDFATRDRYRHAVEQLARSSPDVRDRGRAPRDRPGAAAAPGDSPTATRPGLLSDRPRPGAPSSASSRFRPGLRRRLLRAYVAAGHARLPRHDHPAECRPRRHPAWSSPLWPAPRMPGSRCSRLLALFPAADLAIALTNRGVMERVRPAPLPKLALRGRRAWRSPDAGRGADAPHQRGERARADRPAGDPLPRQSRRRVALRARLGLGRRAGGDDAERRGAPRRRPRRHRPPQRPARPRAGRRSPLLPLPSPARLERGRGGLDRVGAQARQAARAEPPAARRHRHDVPAPGRVARRCREGIRYVITLDADTRLPSGAARELVGTMAHPLNVPLLDPAVGRVVEGYGVLQPRITPTLPEEGDPSLYQRSFSGPCGIDPYASAVSDVYQDLFGEGSYTGKGIYDVDAFEAALAGRVPENSLLSHDLFEGLFARAGLVTDVSLFEEFPSSYLVAAVRQHRWARGDWQLLPWILGRAGSQPAADRALEDARQPAADAVGARRSSCCSSASWLHPVGVAWPVDDVRRRHAAADRARARAARRGAAPARDLEAQPRARRPDRRGDRPDAGGAHPHAARPPGMAHDGRDRADAGAPRHPAPSARMGDRGAGEGPSRCSTLGDVRAAHGRCASAGRRRRRSGRPLASGAVAVGRRRSSRSGCCRPSCAWAISPPPARRRRRAAVGRRDARRCA